MGERREEEQRREVRDGENAVQDCWYEGNDTADVGMAMRNAITAGYFDGVRRGYSIQRWRTKTLSVGGWDDDGVGRKAHNGDSEVVQARRGSAKAYQPEEASRT